MDEWTATQIRALRLALRLSQERLAARLGASSKTVSNWERGLNPPGLESKNSLDDLLSSATQEQRRRYETFLGTLGQAVNAGAMPATPTGVAEVGASALDPASGGEEATDRRQALRAAGAVAVTAVVPDPVHQSLRLFEALGGSRVGVQALEHVDAAVDGLARDYFDKPFDQMSGELSGLRQIALTLMQGTSSLVEQRRLGLATGLLSGMLGALCLDTGDFKSADVHLEVAWRLASDVRHDGLSAWVRALQSNAAFYGGDLRSAVALARAGQEVTTEPTESLRLLSYEARAAAKLGDVGGADRAMRRADVLANGDDVEGPGHRVFDFDLGRFTATTSTSLVWMGEFDRGREQAERALALFDGPYPSRFTGLVAQVDLALVELHEGNVERALALGHGVLDGPRGRSVDVRLRDLDDKLAPLRSSPLVHEFHERALTSR